MGPGMNLDFLTAEECDKIIDVVQKDLVLQHLEQQRLWKINSEIKGVEDLRHVFIRNSTFNDNYCLHCFLKFRLIFRRKFTCELCKANFCSDCVLKEESGEKVFCAFCLKKRQCQRQTLEWFYRSSRWRFRRSGSSKVIQSLTRRHSSSSCFDLRENKTNCDGQSRHEDASGKSDSRSDVFGSDVEEIRHDLPEVRDDTDLKGLAERLMTIQSSCLEENRKMKKHVSELMEMDRSLDDMESTLSSLDDDLLGDCTGQHHHHHHHHHHLMSNSFPADCCLSHSTNDKMLNLAANQIADITSVAVGVLDKSLHKAVDILGELEEEEEEVVEEEEEEGNGKREKEEENNEEEEVIVVEEEEEEEEEEDDDNECNNCHYDVAGQDGDDKNGEEDDEEEEDNATEVSVEMEEDLESMNHLEKLEEAEKEVYKVTCKTFYLEERLLDLEEELNNVDFEERVNLFEEEVAELAAEVDTNQNEVKSLREKLGTA